ncbi:MAG: protein TolQ [Alphaproteobacteria bacterium]
MPPEVAIHTDLSILSLFWQADFFVKSIMLGLLAMSVMTWAIWFAKGRLFAALQQKADNFEDAFAAGEDLESLYTNADPADTDHPMARLYVVALQEWRAGLGRTEDDTLLIRVRRRMDATLTRELELCESWLGFLATVGAISPFIGLLGTVWGIINSFQSIGASKNTSLAVVAPGIAEALMATAIGLFAAIPAVIAYNALSSSLGRYAGRLEAFTLDLLSLFERREDAAKARKR